MVTHVLIHFALLYGIAVLSTLLFIDDFNLYFLPSGFIAGCIGFLVLLIANYWPSYYTDFLPKLDTLIDRREKEEKLQLQQQWLKELRAQLANDYDQIAQEREDLAKQKERLESLQKEIIKCRKAQLHTFSLVLIFYSFDKSTGINSLQCNDRIAALLTKLFGKDPGGIKDCLQMIFGKKQELTPRLRTEIQNRFNEAYSVFDDLDFKEGIKILQGLEQKIVSFSTNPK